MDNTQETIEKGVQPFDMFSHWIRVATDDANGIAEVEKKYGLDFKKAGNKVWETDTFIYLPFTVERFDGETVSTQRSGWMR